jgi:adenine deaminase
MSEEPIEVVACQMRELRHALRELGRDERGFLSIWSITLPVVPSARITDKFLVDTDTQKSVGLFVN